jgi:hypothetical protein
MENLLLVYGFMSLANSEQQKANSEQRTMKDSFVAFTASSE